MARTRVIEMMRGISMVYMIFGHTVQFWLMPRDFWIFAFVFTMSEVMGAGAFLFVSGVAFTFSVRSYAEKVQKAPSVTRPPLWKEVHARTLFIFLFSLVFNGIGGHWLWTWFILQTIAACRLLMLPLMRSSIRARVGVAALVVILTPILYALLVPTAGASTVQVVFYEFLFHAPFLDVMLPFFAFFCLGTVAGELFWDHRNDLYEKGYAELAHLFLRLGAVLFATGIFMGMYTTDWDLGWTTIAYVNLHPWWNFSGVPAFLNRGTPQWCLMALGGMLCVLAFLCAIEKRPRIRNADSRFLSVLSSLSLTLYMLHYVGFFLFAYSLDIYNLWMVDVAYLMFLWACAWLWVKKGNAKYSIEWMIGMGVRVLLRKYYRASTTAPGGG